MLKHILSKFKRNHAAAADCENETVPQGWIPRTSVPARDAGSKEIHNHTIASQGCDTYECGYFVQEAINTAVKTETESLRKQIIELRAMVGFLRSCVICNEGLNAEDEERIDKLFDKTKE